MVAALAFAAAPISSVMGADGVPVDEEHFPDANFRAYVAEFDYNGDGIFSDEEIENATDFFCGDKAINDLKGIEYFTAMRSLDCSHNNLTALDVSKNTAMTELYCYNNNLTTLDVSKDAALTHLECDDNNLAGLDLNQNTALKVLSCGGNNLTGLDLGQNTALTWLLCKDNDLNTLDVSKNVALTYLRCENNKMKTLDLGKVKGVDFSNRALEGNGGKKGKGLTITVGSKADQKLMKKQLKKAGVPKAKVVVRK